MPTKAKNILIAVLGAADWLFGRWRSPRPEFPPLPTVPNDPLLVDALEKAQASLCEFRRLLNEPMRSALVKVRFVSSSNQIEHVWAEVLELPGERELGVRLVTPPVTHSGQLDCLWRCSYEDVRDWEVRDAAGHLHGGFSQRAMLAIARREGVKLPAKLLEREKEYS